MDSDDLGNYRGLIYRAPMAATLLGLFLLSLTGIPLLGGFIGKLYLFLAVVHAGYYWLVVVAAVNTVVSFVYYGGVIKRMFLEEGKTKEAIVIPRLSNALLTVLAVAILLLGIYWSPFADFSQNSVQMTTHSYSMARK